MANLVFLDTETTGLDPDIHDVWEIGLIARTPTGEQEYMALVQPDLTHADPKALEVGGYYERTAGGRRWKDSGEVAVTVARILAGAIVVGSNPAFDERFLTKWLRRHGQAWAAHYRTIDVTTLGWGYLIGREQRTGDDAFDHAAYIPPRSEVISDLLGVDPRNYDRHTALGDCRWARDMYDAITKEES